MNSPGRQAWVDRKLAAAAPRRQVWHHVEQLRGERDLAVKLLSPLGRAAFDNAVELVRKEWAR